MEQHREGVNILNYKKVLGMECELKKSISPGFFDQGTHNQRDLIIYEAYSAIQDLRIFLEKYEKALEATTGEKGESN